MNNRKPALGRNLRRRRQELGLTMKQVAEQVGLTVGFISQVERGLTSPSLSSLSSLSRALDIPMASLLNQPSFSNDLSRMSERGSFEAGGMRYERLSSSFPGCVLRSVIVHEPPGNRAEPISHDGEEMMLILEGGLTVELEGEIAVLSKGDSIHFDSRRVHSTWNHTDGTTTMLWCGTMDIFGDSTNDRPNPIHHDERYSA